MNKISPALVHALKVGLHILVSILIVGLPIYITSNPQVVAQFTSFLLHFGVPIGIANMIIAGLLKFLDGASQQA